VTRRSLVHDYFQAGIVAVILALFVRTYLVQAFQIPSPSMEKTIQVGDHVLVNKFVYGLAATVAGQELLPFTKVERRDVIVFKYPGAPEKDYVKRVIGLPNDTLKIENGVVSIKGPTDTDFAELQENSYAHHTDQLTESERQQLDNLKPTVIPPDHYFVMGDNRDDSRDSREWGLVPQDHIRGKVLLVYWSYVPPPPADGPPPGALQAFWRSAVATFSQTRWKRTFHVIR
jgi:signal peptidase I